MKSSANSIKLLLSLNTIFGTVHVLIKGDIFDRANYNSHSAIITQKKRDVMLMKTMVVV